MSGNRRWNDFDKSKDSVFQTNVREDGNGYIRISIPPHIARKEALSKNDKIKLQVIGVRRNGHR